MADISYMVYAILTLHNVNVFFLLISKLIVYISCDNMIALCHGC